MSSLDTEILADKRIPDAQYPGYNNPWATTNSVYAGYRSDVRWLVFKLIHGQPIIGSVAKRVRSGKTQHQLRNPDRDVIRDEHPEDQWIVRRPPQKNEDGLPIVEEKYRAPQGLRMVISGRPMIWDGRRWVPAATRFKGLSVRRGIPNDLQVQHGPWWPKGREEAARVMRRIHEASEARQRETTQQEQDIKDLLEALGV